MDNINSDRAYEVIRQRILSGEYPAGKALTAKDLAKKIGMSRTPVREAFRQLEAEGLVTIRPRLGARVKHMDANEFRELCELRLALETYAAALAAQNRSESDLREMQYALEAMRKLTDRVSEVRDEKAYRTDVGREDVRFHIAIMSAARNETMKREILRLHLINRVMSGQLPGANAATPAGTKAERDEHDRAVLKHHEEIFDAIKRGDASAARNAMESHIQNAINRNRRQMSADEPSGPAKVLTEQELTYMT